jgi:hypothetical protein
MLMTTSTWTFGSRIVQPKRSRAVAVFATATAAIGLLLGAAVSASDDAKVALEAPAIRAVAGTGDWKSERQAVGRASQAWRIAATRGQDGSLYGRLEVDESPLLRAGNLSGWVVGKTVSGTVTDDDGGFLAKFEGEVDGEWMSGTYTSADGDRGTWVWAEPAARELAEDESAIAAE